MEVANNILLGGMYAKELSQSGKGIKLIKKNGLANEFFFFQSDLTVYGWVTMFFCFYFLSLSNTIQSLSSLNYNLWLLWKRTSCTKQNKNETW